SSCHDSPWPQRSLGNHRIVGGPHGPSGARHHLFGVSGRRVGCAKRHGRRTVRGTAVRGTAAPVSETSSSILTLGRPFAALSAIGIGCEEDQAALGAVGVVRSALDRARHCAARSAGLAARKSSGARRCRHTCRYLPPVSILDAVVSPDDGLPQPPRGRCTLYLRGSPVRLLVAGGSGSRVIRSIGWSTSPTGCCLSIPCARS